MMAKGVGVTLGRRRDLGCQGRLEPAELGPV